VYSRTSSLRNTLSWLSNPTNVDLTKQYTVIDLSAIPTDTQEAMNYLLTAILSLRFNVRSKRKTTIMNRRSRSFPEEYKASEMSFL